MNEAEKKLVKFSFQVLARDPSSQARSGKLELSHGTVFTPVFMPVGTLGAVKGLLTDQLIEMGTEILLSNAYHLYLRPGTRVIQQAGGLHSFMNWKAPILTDSGGFQVFSLASLRKVSDNGVLFRSHLDGSLHEFTPEKVIEIQEILGSDIMMPLDECLGPSASYEEAEQALKRTISWFESSLAAKKREDQVLFPILQGGMFPELREKAALSALSFNPPGFAIGGLSIGESKDKTKEILDSLIPLLPEDKPRYFMGLGTPEDLLEAVEQGVDMFDCVFPTRAGRTGLAFTSRGRMVIRNSPFRFDFSPVDSNCLCYVCKRYTRAYLHHLIHSHEILASILLSYHNVYFMIHLMKEVQNAIQEQRFKEFKLLFHAQNTGSRDCHNIGE
ncbi:MAG: tRNA guanosine(34) transglycosylase Tgt [Candidatus Eremiobacteraeota bacterium]|nr:tRNA guanosine(34) transglycosylase Tgt [Candidatus Eremiobacteraeota bacterium]